MSRRTGRLAAWTAQVPVQHSPSDDNALRCNRLEQVLLANAATTPRDFAGGGALFLRPATNAPRGQHRALGLHESIAVTRESAHMGHSSFCVARLRLSETHGCVKVPDHAHLAWKNCFGEALAPLALARTSIAYPGCHQIKCSSALSTRSPFFRNYTSPRPSESRARVLHNKSEHPTRPRLARIGWLGRMAAHRNNNKCAWCPPWQGSHHQWPPLRSNAGLLWLPRS